MSAAEAIILLDELIADPASIEFYGINERLLNKLKTARSVAAIDMDCRSTPAPKVREAVARAICRAFTKLHKLKDVKPEDRDGALEMETEHAWDMWLNEADAAITACLAHEGDYDARLGRVVWQFIDRMNDPCDKVDPPTRILDQFTRTVNPIMVEAVAHRTREERPPSMWEGEDGTVTGYMCLVDWEVELGGASSGNTVYPSVDDLRRRRKCVDGCGIVEVRVEAVRVVQKPQDEDESINLGGLTPP